MNRVAHRLGIETANRVLIDLAVSKNPSATQFLACPVLDRRRLIDANFWRVIDEWGGGYPRPLVEFAHGSGITRVQPKTNQGMFVEIGEDFDTYDLR